MRQLIQMSRHIRNDKIQNDCIQEKVDVALIEEKMMDTQLWWFGYM